MATPEAGLILHEDAHKASLPNLKFELQSHQKHNVARFIQCIKYGDGGVLIADDLGLGKTCSAIACVEMLKRVVLPNFKDFKTLIIVPKSVCFQWTEEILKFTEYESKDVSVNWNNPGAVFHLATYETLRAVFIDSFEKKDKTWSPKNSSVHFAFIPDFFKCIVFDEIHRIRNKTAVVHHAAKFLGATGRVNWITPRIGLSGTPIVNGYSDMTSIATILKFPVKFAEVRFYEQLNQASGVEFATTVYCKHFKSEALQLPELTTKTHVLTLSDEEKRIHREYVSRLNTEVSNFSERKTSCFTDVIVALVRLRQICIHPDLPAVTSVGADVADEDTYSSSDEELDDNDNYVAKPSAIVKKRKRTHEEMQERASRVREAIQNLALTWRRSSKFVWLVGRAHVYKSENRQFIVFSSFATAACAVDAVLRNEGFRVATYIGSTSDAARKDAIRSFKNGQLDALVMTFGAGGTGLHLAPAGTAVVHLDAAWTPAAHEQAQNRVHRYGTVRDVCNDYVVAEGSVDEYVYKNVHVKKQSYANALDKIVNHVRNKPAKSNASASVNMVQVMSLLRWFSQNSRNKIYEEQSVAAGLLPDTANLK
jgi:SNF2 family DNA or RNA helicase